ncbi:MAG: hypothetical protein PHC70_04350 [Patescibacteria group bacterium]|nr:hypothetical protein [Patescibacteria group bacterium]
MFGKDPIIHLHQITGYEDVKVLPAARYLERSLLLGGRVYVNNQTDLTCLPWLEEVGLAPERVIRVPNECMFTGLRDDPALMAELREAIAHGARLMFFRPTQLAVEFIKGAGLTWDQTASCDPDVADHIGLKDCLRLIAEKLGLERSFPPYALLRSDWSMAELNVAIAAVRKNSSDLGMSGVVVKRTDLVSGEGMGIVGSHDFRNFIERQRRHPLIVEAEILPHTSISNQWCVVNGDLVYAGTTRQIMDGFDRQGDVIASDDGVLPGAVVEKLRRLAEPFARYAVELGYNGVIGFDAVWHEDKNLVFLTEANARVTAATYPFGVAKRLGYKDWAIASKTMIPAPWIETFNSVRGRLGNSLLFNPRRQCGVVPYMTGALSHPTLRRMGLMAIANDSRRAEQTLAEAEKRLTS